MLLNCNTHLPQSVWPMVMEFVAQQHMWGTTLPLPVLKVLNIFSLWFWTSANFGISPKPADNSSLHGGWCCLVCVSNGPGNRNIRSRGNNQTSNLLLVWRCTIGNHINVAQASQNNLQKHSIEIIAQESIPLLQLRIWMFLHVSM